jgi:hypothetical protein
MVAKSRKMKWVRHEAHYDSWEEHNKVNSIRIKGEEHFWDLIFPACTFHGLGPVSSSKSELTSQTMSNFRYFGRSVWTGIGPSQSLYLHRETAHGKMRIYIYFSNEIWAHNPIVRAIQDHTHLRQRGHWDRQMLTLISILISCDTVD